MSIGTFYLLSFCGTLQFGVAARQGRAGSTADFEQLCEEFLCLLPVA